MADRFEGFESITSNPESWGVVVPSDAADLASKPKAIHCKAAGNVAMVGADGVEVIFAFTAGQTLNLRPTRIKATGTTVTAGNVIALY